MQNYDLTNMVRPMESVNKEPCFLEKMWLAVQNIVVKIASIVVNDNIWSLNKGNDLIIWLFK